MRRRLAALAAVAACSALAGCGTGHAAAGPSTSPRAAASRTASPSPSQRHYPDKAFGQRCKWNNGFVMSVRDAHRLTGEMVPAGDAWYTATIRVSNESDEPIAMPLDDFRPNALIGPNNFAAGEWTGDNTNRLTGTLTAGKTVTGSFGYSVPESEAGPQVQVQWMFADDTEPCTFAGRVS